MWFGFMKSYENTKKIKYLFFCYPEKDSSVAANFMFLIRVF